MFKNKLKLFLLILAVFAFFGTTFQVKADWQQTLGSQFDIVETFDQLQDWRGINNLRGYDTDKSHMPVKIDGTPSMWDVYDEWFFTDTNTDWIANHGAENVWKGHGKSLRMHLGSSSSVSDSIPRGPSRFGLYFGSDTPGQANAYATSGLANSGYNDVYVFYMIKMSPKIFPTINGGLWPNDGYKWWGYHKFFTIGTAFTNVDHINGASDRRGTGCRYEYGCSDYLLQWRICGSRCDDTFSSALNQYGTVQTFDVSGEYTTSYSRKEGLSNGFNNFLINEAIKNQKWFGLEVHVNRGSDQNSDQATASGDGSVEVWVYDELGNSYKIYEDHTLLFRQIGTDFSFNKFFFGGNISYGDDIDVQGLDVTYYVDDFIINGSRIGPTYFQLLNNIQSIRADVNQDNQITSTDAMLTLRKSLNLDMSQTNWQDSTTTGDVNCDNTVNSTDVTLILRKSLNLDMTNTDWCGN